MNLYLELFGYLGSAMVVVSMLMSSVVKLRIINTLGSVISGTYALIIGSFPLALMNICLVVINGWNLWKLLKTRKQYHLVRCGLEDAFVAFFTDHYRQDIHVYFPHFEQAQKLATEVFLVACNGDPAGILLSREVSPGELEALVEYTTPTYRDCSMGTVRVWIPSSGRAE